MDQDLIAVRFVVRRAEGLSAFVWSKLALAPPRGNTSESKGEIQAGLPVEVWWESVAWPHRKSERVAGKVTAVPSTDNDEFRIEAEIELPQTSLRRFKVRALVDKQYPVTLLAVNPRWQDWGTGLLTVALVLAGGGSGALILFELEATPIYKLLVSAGLLGAPTLAALVARFRGLSARSAAGICCVVLLLAGLLGAFIEARAKVELTGEDDKVGPKVEWSLSPAGTAPEDCVEISAPRSTKGAGKFEAAQLGVGYFNLGRRYFFCNSKRLAVPCQHVEDHAWQLPDLDGKGCWLRIPGRVPGTVWTPLEGTSLPKTIDVLRDDVLPAEPSSSDVLRLELDLAGKQRVNITLDGQWATSSSERSITVPRVTAAGSLGLTISGRRGVQCDVTSETRCVSLIELPRPNAGALILAHSSTNPDCSERRICGEAPGVPDVEGVRAPQWLLSTGTADKGFTVRVGAELGKLSANQGCDRGLTWVRVRGPVAPVVKVGAFLWEGREGKGFLTCGKPVGDHAYSADPKGKLRVSSEGDQLFAKILRAGHSGYCFHDNVKCWDAGGKQTTDRVTFIKTYPGCSLCIAAYAP